MNFFFCWNNKNNIIIKYFCYKINNRFVLINDSILCLIKIIKMLKLINIYKNKNNLFEMGIGDWGLGIGDWGLGPIPNPQSPIPNPQSPIKNYNYLN